MSAASRAQLSDLAAHLAGRRPELLRAWRQLVADDPQLPSADVLTRSQLEDHIPEILDGYERILAAGPEVLPPDPYARQLADTIEHGLHRWQQGYQLKELVREWGHLHLCLVDELERYAAANPGLDPRVMAFARRELAALARDGVSKSAAEYFDLHRAEAAAQVRDLESALDQVRALEAQRAELLRETAHDLRNTLGAAMTTAAVLGFNGLPDDKRSRFAGTLQRGLDGLKTMLNDLMSLARLEAGQEWRQVEPFDAAALLRELCDTARPLADDRDLELRADGPAELWVDGDPIKVRRVAQNLVLNALKYTRQGGVTVGWSVPRPGQWVLTVADTGPGFRAGSAVPIAAALEEATATAHHEAPPPPPPDPPGAGVPGEGIGLTIVKRLCELLDAAIELESIPGRGSTFRVTFPARYPNP